MPLSYNKSKINTFPPKKIIYLKVCKSTDFLTFNPLHAELNTICDFKALVGTQYVLHVSRVRVNCILVILLDGHVLVLLKFHTSIAQINVILGIRFVPRILILLPHKQYYCYLILFYE
jgi:hypothetical protein